MADDNEREERRKGPSDRRIPNSDRRTGDRVVEEQNPRRKNPDRRKN
ncbi:MAG: hypothetical protein ISP91_07935 [Pseudomonadales bacterium]|nr:hypothetical protein [Pseudomonadales bacterium]